MTQKERALRHMKTLGVMPQIITDFKRSGRLYYSEYTPIGGILYWVDNEPDWMQKVREWEENTGNLAYHALHFFLKDGDELLVILYAGHLEEETEWEVGAVDARIPWCYTMNLTCPEWSEYGSIAVREAAGGLIPEA